VFGGGVEANRVCVVSEKRRCIRQVSPSALPLFPPLFPFLHLSRLSFLFLLRASPLFIFFFPALSPVDLLLLSEFRFALDCILLFYVVFLFLPPSLFLHLIVLLMLSWLCSPLVVPFLPPSLPQIHPLQSSSSSSLCSILYL